MHGRIHRLAALLRGRGYICRAHPFSRLIEIDTPGWRYRLKITKLGRTATQFTLKPENTSQRYRSLCDLIADLSAPKPNSRP